MSDTSMTNEFAQLADAFGWGMDDFEWITINTVKSAFAAFPERLRIINAIVKPRYALLSAEQALGAQ
jgi:adenosine deaminase